MDFRFLAPVFALTLAACASTTTTTPPASKGEVATNDYMDHLDSSEERYSQDSGQGVDQRSLSSAHFSIACWELKARRGARPFLTAKVLGQKKISNLEFVFNKEFYGDSWKIPSNDDAEGPFTGELNESNRSPYKGTYDFGITNDFRLILPLLTQDIENEHVGNETHDSRQNAVAVVNVSGQGGDGFVRMHCRAE